MKPVTIAALILFTACSFGATATEVGDDCLKDLNYLPDFLLRNDAGAKDRVAQVGGPALDQALETAREEAGNARTERACNAALTGYLGHWRKGHIAIQPIDEEKGDRSIRMGTPAEDYTPGIQRLSESTVLVKIRSFHPEAGKRLQYALHERREELAQYQNWIVDVRSNHGGSDSAYLPLLPWLLSGEIAEVQLEFLATGDNVESTLKLCELYAPGDKHCEEFVKPIVGTMLMVPPGTFVRTADDEVAFIPVPEADHKYPQRVAVLVDEDCVSSCEQFLLTVRQSFRVKLLGRNSRGNLDYSNLRPHMLPSGKRQLLYATSRSYRLPHSPVDAAGVMPDIYLPKPRSKKEWDEEVIRAKNWLEGGSLAPIAPVERP